MKFVIYKDSKNEWRFRLKARNGRIVASGESYKRRIDCIKTIKRIQLDAGRAKICGAD